MSVSGLCELCATREVTHTCNRCASLVCDRHYDEDSGYCVECAAEVGRPGREPAGGGEERPDGVDEYQF